MGLSSVYHHFSYFPLKYTNFLEAQNAANKGLVNSCVTKNVADDFEVWPYLPPRGRGLHSLPQLEISKLLPCQRVIDFNWFSIDEDDVAKNLP